MPAFVSRSRLLVPEAADGTGTVSSLQSKVLTATAAAIGTGLGNEILQRLAELGQFITG